MDFIEQAYTVSLQQWDYTDVIIEENNKVNRDTYGRLVPHVCTTFG